MIVAVSIIILIAALAVAFERTKNKSNKRKLIIWGVTTMLVIAPIFSWLLSISYAGVEGSAWAGVALISIVFPIIFLIGLVIFLVGVFRKKDTESIENQINHINDND